MSLTEVDFQGMDRQKTKNTGIFTQWDTIQPQKNKNKKI